MIGMGELAKRYERGLLSRICTAAAELAGLNQEAPRATSDAWRLLKTLDILREELDWWFIEEADRNV